MTLEMRLKHVWERLGVVAGLAVVPAIAAAAPQTNQVSEHFLLNDRLGNITQVPTNEVHS